MIINGNARSGAFDLARHLARADTNEHVSIVEMRGTVANDLLGCFREMEGVATGTRCGRPLYHANIDPARDYVMTDAQWAMAVDDLEKELGLIGQPRAVVKHVKHGREHLHVVWSRINAKHMRAIPDSHNYRKHEVVARRLEKLLGHEIVQGVHVDRNIDAPRPQAELSTAEGQQAARSGLDPRAIKAAITALWHQTDSASAFVAALESEGYQLARGDRRDFVLLDPAGEVHSLARRIDGVNTAEVRRRLDSLDPAALPSVAEARVQMKQRAVSDAPDLNNIAQVSEQKEDSIPPKDQTVTPEEDDPRRGEALRAEALLSAVESFVTHQSGVYQARLDKQIEGLESAALRRIDSDLTEFDHARRPKLTREDALELKTRDQTRREAEARQSEREAGKPGFWRRLGELLIPGLRQKREQAERQTRLANAANRQTVYARELTDIKGLYKAYESSRLDKEITLRQSWQDEKARLETRNQTDMAAYRKRETEASYAKLDTTEKDHAEKLNACRADVQRQSKTKPASVVTAEDVKANEQAIQYYGQLRGEQARDYSRLKTDSPVRVRPANEREAATFIKEEAQFRAVLDAAHKERQQKEQERQSYNHPNNGYGGYKL